MCLGVPGQVVEILEDSTGILMGKVSFAGATREVCLAYTPDVQVGEYVLVHVGFALNKLDEEEAQSIFEALEELAEAQRKVDEERSRVEEERAGGEAPTS